MSRTRLLAASLAVSLLAGAASAQQPAIAAAAEREPPSALARDVALASGITQSFENILTSFPDRLRQSTVTRPEIAKDLNEVLDAMKPEMELQKQQMVNAAARIYAERHDARAS